MCEGDAKQVRQRRRRSGGCGTINRGCVAPQAFDFASWFAACCIAASTSSALFGTAFPYHASAASPAQIAPDAPRPPAAPGLARLHLSTRPNSSESCMFSSAAAASSGSWNSTKANPRCFSAEVTTREEASECANVRAVVSAGALARTLLLRCPLCTDEMQRPLEAALAADLRTDGMLRSALCRPPPHRDRLESEAQRQREQ